MLRDDVPFQNVWHRLRGNDTFAQAGLSLISFIEQKFGARFVFRRDDLPFGNTELIEFGPLIEALQKTGVIRAMEQVRFRPDEPRHSEWIIQYGEKPSQIAIGSSSNEQMAVAKAVAEAIERFIWSHRTDYFARALVSNETALGNAKPHVELARFAGAADEARASAPYLWTQAHSWVSGRPVWLPAQTISGADLSELNPGEPSIRDRVTTGLATHTSRTEAVLNGALEVIERDAYMIWWLNQLVVPRYDAAELAQKRPTLSKLIEQCRRYRFQPHFLALASDAPVHAVCVVLEDLSEHEPRFGIGTAAHHECAHAAEKALFEALRWHRSARRRLEHADEQSDSAHYGRLGYWARADRFELIAPLLKGSKAPVPIDPVKSATEHLHAITQWARSSGYELASVSLTKSAANVSPWHIEMVVIPELQPLYFNENGRIPRSPRLRDIPQKRGYSARDALFTEHPHPFA